MQKTRKSRVEMILRLAFGLICLALAAACSNGTGSEKNASKAAANALDNAKREIFAMDTYMTVTCFGKNCDEAADAAIAEIRRIDALLSVSSEQGEIYAVNRDGGGKLGVDAETIVRKALDIYRKTDGKFDITIYPLMEAWGFTDLSFSVPPQERIDEILKLVGSDKLDLADGVLDLGGARGVDLGGIAKGYTSDRLMEVFKSYDIVSGCVSLGGNVQCFGRKPDGSLWRCGVVHPLKPDSNEYLGVVAVENKAVITSGAYERYFVDEENGETYHHIIDPRTGYPANNGLISVTIISESGMLADALSTSCYIMGLDGAMEYWRKYGSDFDMILMTDGGELYVTAPIAENFTSTIQIKLIER